MKWSGQPSIPTLSSYSRHNATSQSGFLLEPAISRVRSLPFPPPSLFLSHSLSVSLPKWTFPGRICRATYPFFFINRDEEVKFDKKGNTRESYGVSPLSPEEISCLIRRITPCTLYTRRRPGEQRAPNGKHIRTLIVAKLFAYKSCLHTRGSCTCEVFPNAESSHTRGPCEKETEQKGEREREREWTRRHLRSPCTREILWNARAPAHAKFLHVRTSGWSAG